MLFAANNCATFLIEVVPATCRWMADIVELLFKQFVPPVHIDFAEQCISVLLPLSQLFSHRILIKNGLVTFQEYVDFFSIPTQRSIYRIISNCALCITQSEYAGVGITPQLMSLFANRLSFLEDTLSVDALCVFFARMINNCMHDPALLREIIGEHQEYLNCVPHIIRRHATHLTPSTFSAFLRSLMLLWECRDLTLKLINMDIYSALYFLLTGREVTEESNTGVGEQSSRKTAIIANLSPAQVADVCSVLTALLPEVPSSGVFVRNETLTQFIELKYGAREATTRQRKRYLWRIQSKGKPQNPPSKPYDDDECYWYGGYEDFTNPSFYIDQWFSPYQNREIQDFFGSDRDENGEEQTGGDTSAEVKEEAPKEAVECLSEAESAAVELCYLGYKQGDYGKFRLRLFSSNDVFVVQFAKMMCTNLKTGEEFRMERQAVDAKSLWSEKTEKTTDGKEDEREMFRVNGGSAYKRYLTMYSVVIEFGLTSSCALSRFFALRTVSCFLYAISVFEDDEKRAQLKDVPLAVFISSTLSSFKTLEMLVAVLQVIHLALDQLPDVYVPLFESEGVFFEVGKCIEAIQLAKKEDEKQEQEKASKTPFSLEVGSTLLSDGSEEVKNQTVSKRVSYINKYAADGSNDAASEPSVSYLNMHSASTIKTVSDVAGNGKQEEKAINVTEAYLIEFVGTQWVNISQKYLSNFDAEPSSYTFKALVRIAKTLNEFIDFGETENEHDDLVALKELRQLLADAEKLTSFQLVQSKMFDALQRYLSFDGACAEASSGRKVGERISRRRRLEKFVSIFFFDSKNGSLKNVEEKDIRELGAGNCDERKMAPFRNLVLKLLNAIDHLEQFQLRFVSIVQCSNGEYRLSSSLIAKTFSDQTLNILKKMQIRFRMHIHSSCQDSVEFFCEEFSINLMSTVGELEQLVAESVTFKRELSLQNAELLNGNATTAATDDPQSPTSCSNNVAISGLPNEGEDSTLVPFTNDEQFQQPVQENDSAEPIMPLLLDISSLTDETNDDENNARNRGADKEENNHLTYINFFESAAVNVGRVELFVGEQMLPSNIIILEALLKYILPFFDENWKNNVGVLTCSMYNIQFKAYSVDSMVTAVSTSNDTTTLYTAASGTNTNGIIESDDVSWSNSSVSSAYTALTSVPNQPSSFYVGATVDAPAVVGNGKSSRVGRRRVASVGQAEHERDVSIDIAADSESSRDTQFSSPPDRKMAKVLISDNNAASDKNNVQVNFDNMPGEAMEDMFEEVDLMDVMFGKYLEKKLNTQTLVDELENKPEAQSMALLNSLYTLNEHWWHLLPFDCRQMVAFPYNSFISKSLFQSNKLNSKVQQQLSDVVCVIADYFPRWCTILMSRMPFVCSFETRQNYLRFTAFGHERTICHLCNSIFTSVNHNQGNEHYLRHHRRSDNLTKRKITVKRDHILHDAQRALSAINSLKESLEVNFSGEEGTGYGPTLEFYASLSRELQRHSLRLWHGMSVVDGSVLNPSENQENSEECFTHGEKGLYPRITQSDSQPFSNLEKEDSSRLELFELLGKVLAHTLLDSRILDIPFIPSFLKWLHIDGNAFEAQNAYAYFDLKDFAAAEPTLFSSLSNLTKLRANEFDQLDMFFVYPGDNEVELLKNGAQIAVTRSNIIKFANLLCRWRMCDGVQHEVLAVRRGFHAVAGERAAKTLAIFTDDELMQLFCGCCDEESGDDDGNWSKKALREVLRTDHGYTSESIQVRWLVDMLSAFSHSERRKFLQFITGSPRLPIGGFRSLKPPLTVVRKTMTDSMELPSVMTCFNYLKLPPYETYELFVERFQVTLNFADSFYLT